MVTLLTQPLAPSRVAEDAARGVATDAAPVGRWWVLHTRARNEKAVAAALERCEIPHFLPLVESRRRGGRGSAQIPLFPGYLFLRGEVRDCEVAWQTNRVANILRVDYQARLEQELEHIRRVVLSGAPVDLYPAIRVGRSCRIVAGPLAGVEGVVVRRRGVSRVYVAATVLGQSALVETDTENVEPID